MHDRHDLTDEQWEQLKPLLPPEGACRRGRPWTPHRQVINGILWRTRTGSPWRDVPPTYGAWGTVYGRHRTWSADGTWDEVLAGLQRGCDLEQQEWTVSVDSTVVRAHQDAAGAPHAAPTDVSAERLAVALTGASQGSPVESASTAGAGHTGGFIE